MFRRPHIDWRMAAGFSGLLFLILAIGFIGITQIQGLSRAVSFLAQESMPLQNAILEMKSTNSKYAMGIRSYMFWRSAKYLDSAAMAEKLNFVRELSQNFDKLLAFYISYAKTPAQREWAETIRINQELLRRIGEDAIALVNQLDKSSSAARRKLEEDINRYLMDFENKLFQIDAFLDSPLQEDNLKAIDMQLTTTQHSGRQSIVFLLWSIVVGLGLAAQTIYLIYRRNKTEHEHRELLWRKIIRIEEEERGKLAFEIHDQLGQDLSGLKIYLGLIEKDMPQDLNDAREKIDKAKSVLRGLMERAHNISELLRPPELDDLGLIESLDALIKQYKEVTGGEYNFNRPARDIKLSSEQSLALYRVVQEALTNIAKYSQAQNVNVSLKLDKGFISLKVHDDGKGFDYEAYANNPSRRQDDKIRLGLRGLRERIEVLGGRLKIKSRLGDGTRLEVELPVG